jgi:hypothetical protein
MTNYGIPQCYGTTAGTKNNGRANYNKDNIPRPEILNQVQNDEGYTRANYNIHRNTHIGDSSLYARNDEYRNATTINGYAQADSQVKLINLKDFVINSTEFTINSTEFKVNSKEFRTNSRDFEVNSKDGKANSGKAKTKEKMSQQPADMLS